MRYPKLYDRSSVDFSVDAQMPVHLWHASDAPYVAGVPDTQLCGAAAVAAPHNAWEAGLNEASIR
jgi:hypothetical protein